MNNKVCHCEEELKGRRGNLNEIASFPLVTRNDKMEIMKYIFNVILLGLVLMGCSKNPFAPVNSSEIGGFVQSTNFHDKKFGYRIHTKGEAKYYKSVTVVFPDGTQKEFENKSNTSPDGNTRWTILGDMFGLPILGEYKFL